MQATEPDAVFLGDPNAFCVPRTSPSNPNPGGNTVASAAPALGDVDLSAFLVTLRTQGNSDTADQLCLLVIAAVLARQFQHSNIVVVVKLASSSVYLDP